MQIPVFRTWILRLSANLSRKFTRFSAWILTLHALRHWLSVVWNSWGLDIMHDWRFNQFSVFSALNLEIGRDEILDWRAAYYVNFGDVIDSSAVLMTWSIWRLKYPFMREASKMMREAKIDTIVQVLTVHVPVQILLSQASIVTVFCYTGRQPRMVA